MCVRCWVVHMPFVFIVKFKLLSHPMDHLPTQSCLVLYSFCANLLHSLIMWLIVSLLFTINIYSEFFTSALADGLSLEMSDSKSPQVSRTLLSILAVFNNAVVWIVSTLSLEFERQWVPSCFQDSSQYPGRSQPCFSLDSVPIRPSISNSSTLLSQLLETVSREPTTIGITVTLMFHRFLSSQVISSHLSLFSLSLIIALSSSGMTSPWYGKIFYFFC